MNNKNSFLIIINICHYLINNLYKILNERDIKYLKILNIFINTNKNI